MGIFIRQNDNRSQLQERIAADLRERAKQKMAGTEPLDQARKSNYIKDTELSSTRLWVWFFGAGIVLVAVVVFLIVR